jgi:hypothetical protein
VEYAKGDAVVRLYLCAGHILVVAEFDSETRFVQYRISIRTVGCSMVLTYHCAWHYVDPWGWGREGKICKMNKSTLGG